MRTVTNIEQAFDIANTLEDEEQVVVKVINRGIIYLFYRYKDTLYWCDREYMSRRRVRDAE